jgi:hypothetical protein
VTGNVINSPVTGAGGSFTEGWKLRVPWLHQVKGYFVYELPLGSGKHWLPQPGALNYLVGGWVPDNYLLPGELGVISS